MNRSGGYAARLRAMLGARPPPPRVPPPPSNSHPHFGDIAGLDLAGWLARYPDHGAPTRSILLATDERTGSEWLCQLLGGTGRLGRPSEYLNTDWMRRFIPDYPELVAAQIGIAHRVGTTANGCFTMKLHPWHMDRLLREGGAISTTFPAPQVVRLVRHDLLGQAISLHRARATGSYHAHIAAERAADYDAVAIEAMIRELAGNRARWAMYFARVGLAPLELSYEELCANPLETVRPRDLAAVRPIQPQADALSREWRARFVRECGNLDRFAPL